MPLTLRLTLTYLLVTLGGFLLLGGGLLVLAGQYLTRQSELELAAQADIYTSLLAELVPSADALPALAPGLASSAAVPAGVTVRIFSSGGTLVSDSAGLGPFPSHPVAALVSSPFPLPLSQSSDRQYVARRISGGNAALGVVELSRATDNETRLLNDLRNVLVQAAFLAALAMTLVSIVVARSIARPIVRLTRRAADLMAGSGPQVEDAATTLTRAGRRASRDEIGLLAQTLEQMAAQVQARIVDAEQERARLAVVLTSIYEGVVALDAAGAVLFANPATAELLGAPTPALIPARLATLELPLPARARIEQELRLDERDLSITITPARAEETESGWQEHGAAESVLRASMPPAIATVLVLRDITRLKELEQARARFFRSISHDLRTPLTTIRGALENLRDVAPPEQQATLAGLEDEAARLSRLVDELLHPPASGLLLSTERRRVDMGAVSQELCALQQGRARRAGITLSCRVEAGLPPVYGDRDRLKQALLNLLDNALKVTPPGGTISVDVRRNAERLAITVADSGPGVPPELRTQIWERGARGADLGQRDARLDYGGVGLGLAIVREIAVAHGGRAWIEANEPQGARFILELPTRSG